MDKDVLVLVDYDPVTPEMVKEKKYGHEFDARLLSVHFISGALSGRQGHVQRYRLVRLGE